jgi:hypothetical protein
MGKCKEIERIHAATRSGEIGMAEIVPFVEKGHSTTFGAGI